ncbi:unnamed protein product [Eruca vesicaria subsp. sativa]|uniref:F-box domain-containing protein n=1 Tax=Eruca vesicaria subsp. sativa TaxID=29727 RepID=A0ABC8M236_ERUVS|nr:unnamed protein product [Eruca vesicaria subsp. sativa]
MTLQSLPLDLAEEILYKLPIESIVRFKSVCKDWHALINDKRFIYKLLDLSHDRTMYTIPDKLHNYTLKAIIHCDGLLLCKVVEGGKHDNGRKLAVWNPFVNGLKWIEPSTTYKYFDVFAFGYDSVSRDNYKILRIDIDMGGETFKPICVPEGTDRFHGSSVDRVLLSGYGEDRLSLLQRHTYSKTEVWVTNKLTDGDVSWSKYFSFTLADFPIIPSRSDHRFLAYCIHKTKNIMFWVEEVEYEEAYIFTDVYVLDEGKKIDKQVEGTIRRTFKDQSCYHVYVPSLVPVPE